VENRFQSLPFKCNLQRYPEEFKSDSKKEKEKRKREAATAAAEKEKGEKRMTAAKRRQLESWEDFDDINDDYRALKKLKKGKISEVGGLYKLNPVP
jgi:sRNA-binding protein